MYQASGDGSEEEGGSLWEAGLDPEVPHSMQAGRCRVHRCVLISDKVLIKGFTRVNSPTNPSTLIHKKEQ